MKEPTEKVLKDGVKEMAAAMSEEKVTPVPLKVIKPNPFQPRTIFKKGAMEELEASIKEKGVRQPIILRPITDPDSEYLYEIVAGERRVRASRNLGLETIPAIIRPVSDQDMSEDALIENLQREQMTFWDTKTGIVRLRETLGSAQFAARRLGFHERTVEKYIQIHNALATVPEIEELLAKEAAHLEYSTAEAFSKLMPNIKRLQKSNAREFQQILKAIKKKGVEAKLGDLRRKFNKADKTATASDEKTFFSETATHYVLSVKVPKKGSLPSETLDRMQKASATFFEKVAGVV